MLTKGLSLGVRHFILFIQYIRKQIIDVCSFANFTKSYLLIIRNSLYNRKVVEHQIYIYTAFTKRIITSLIRKIDIKLLVRKDESEIFFKWSLLIKTNF